MTAFPRVDVPPLVCCCLSSILASATPAHTYAEVPAQPRRYFLTLRLVESAKEPIGDFGGFIGGHVNFEIGALS